MSQYHVSLCLYVLFSYFNKDLLKFSHVPSSVTGAEIQQDRNKVSVLMRRRHLLQSLVLGACYTHLLIVHIIKCQKDL